VVSLLQSGHVEVRLLQGAPGLGGATTDSGSASGSTESVFAVFDLTRKPGPCSY
jgi:hypothetical protein